MAIKKIKVSNFKSFDELEVELRPLNVVVGANASGKSNFIEIFRFLRDIVAFGLENAVSIQGGLEYLKNLQLDPARPLVLELEYADDEFSAFLETYRLVLSVNRSATGGFDVLEETAGPDLGDGKRTRERNLPFPNLAFDLAIFDFEPKLSKLAIPVGGKADLEPDASNLAVTLRNILRDEAKGKALVRLVRDLLPFVEDVRVDRFADKHLLINLKESYSKNFLPASILSDGTIQLTALIYALYFDRAAFIAMEEPERYIHPHLVSRVVDLLVDTSRYKQLVVTTHSPELVKNADLADLLLVKRDKRGFSRISRPAESDELKIFLGNELGVDMLFVQNLLDVGHPI
jgi:predicted ATPase